MSSRKDSPNEKSFPKKKRVGKRSSMWLTEDSSKKNRVSTVINAVVNENPVTNEDLLRYLEDREYFLNDQYSITFGKKFTKDFISAVHKGWKCPSGYNDSSPEEGCAYVQRGKYVLFEADDYGRNDYLILELFGDNNLKVIHDRQHNLEGVVLRRNRYKPHTILPI